MKKTYWFVISETTLATAALLTANYFGWHDTPAFYGIEPHPFFAVILLMASRYGTFGGLFSSAVLSAVLCTVSYYFGGHLISEDPYLIRLVALLCSTGWIIGEIRQMYIKQTQKLERTLSHEQHTVKQLTEKNELISKVNNEMERRILDEVSTFSSLYETSKQLQSFEIEKIYHAILTVLVQYLEAEHCSIYILNKETITLKESIGKRERPEQLSLADDSHMITRCVNKRRVYSIRDFLDKKIDMLFVHDHPIMCAPLVKTDGMLIGALVIEKMPFFHITGSSIKIFSLLADWVSSDIENAMYFQEVQNKNILDEVLNVFTSHYMHTRLNQEFYRSKRYTLPLSLILVKIDNIENAPVDWQLNILKFFATTLNTALRLTDIVTSYKESVPFAMILTMTDAQQAVMAVARLRGILNNMGIDTMDNGNPVTVHFGIGSFTSTMETKEDLIMQAEEHLIQCVQQNASNIPS